MVADITGTLPPHSLKELSEEHCWMLMRERAFAEEEKYKYPNLETIGKQIVKKCSGVPMAAKALGGLLRFKRTEKEWIYVKESELWNLPQEETFILPALRLSYYHLPLELRQCFAYCAVFPKDISIGKEELISLWMAHGYISSKGVLEVEDVGNEICNELVLRSLFQCDSFKTDYIMMHDLVHDLARSIMENKVPGLQVEQEVSSTSNTKIRQVNLREKLVAFPTSTQHDMDISFILTKFNHLRVLDASDAEIKYLPSTVGNLKHLRLLNLSGSEVRTLPNSLCSLWNLQTLNLNECWWLVALPRNMKYLKNLRHLFMEACVSLRRMPSKIRELTRLKTLGLFIVGRNRGNQLEELQCLDLGGRLEIKHLERVRSYTDAKKANLGEKKDLRFLSLEWESKSESESRADIDEKVLEALQPHPNLQTLSLRGFSGSCFPVWMTSLDQKNLFGIDIVDCPQISHLPEFGKLPHLGFLRLEKVGVEYMIEDENAEDTLFPSLKTLELCSLPHLKRVLKEQVNKQVFPNLRKLKIDCCSSLILPQLSSLKELDIQNCGGVMLTTSFARLDSLTSLVVGFGENMKSIPMEMLEKLTNLETLTIVGAEEDSLAEEGLRALKSLTELKIENSKRLRCLPVGWLRHLTALKSVSVNCCPELIELPDGIKELEHLETIELNNVAKMVCLPKALRHISPLKQLSIFSLPQLNSLPDWMDELSSLRILQIIDCPKLVSLPASIRAMPNLQLLGISECPELERRCQRGSGEDWHHISHIPNLFIN